MEDGQRGERGRTLNVISVFTRGARKLCLKSSWEDIKWLLAQEKVILLVTFAVKQSEETGNTVKSGRGVLARGNKFKGACNVTFQGSDGEC